MQQLNNKGQTLVIFIFIIPILIGLMALVIDIGNLIYYKQDLDNINKIVLDYGLNNQQTPELEEKMITLAKLNNPHLNIKIKQEENIIYIKTTYYVQGIFTNIFQTKGYQATSIYKAYQENQQNKIEKIK